MRGAWAPPYCFVLSPCLSLYASRARGSPVEATAQPALPDCAKGSPVEVEHDVPETRDQAFWPGSIACFQAHPRSLFARPNRETIYITRVRPENPFIAFWRSVLSRVLGRGSGH